MSRETIYVGAREGPVIPNQVGPVVIVDHCGSEPLSSPSTGGSRLRGQGCGGSGRGAPRHPLQLQHGRCLRAQELVALPAMTS